MSTFAALELELSSAEFLRLIELLLSLGNLPRIVELRLSPGISLCFLVIFFTVADLEMAPRLSAGAFVVFLTPADPPLKLEPRGFGYQRWPSRGWQTGLYLLWHPWN